MAFLWAIPLFLGPTLEKTIFFWIFLFFLTSFLADGSHSHTDDSNEEEFREETNINPTRWVQIFVFHCGNATITGAQGRDSTFFRSVFHFSWDFFYIFSYKNFEHTLDEISSFFGALFPPSHQGGKSNQTRWEQEKRFSGFIFDPELSIFPHPFPVCFSQPDFLGILKRKKSISIFLLS